MTDKKELPLNQVTVLTDGAILTHLGKLTLPKGEQTIVITKLSEYLDADSVRVKGKGKVALIDVAPRMEYIRYEDKELSEIDKQIKIMEDKIREKQLEHEVIEVSMTTLDETIKNVSSGFGEWGLRKGLTAEDYNNYFEYYQKGARGERTKLIKLKKQIEEFQEEIEILRNKRNQISVSDSRFYEVDLTLDVKVEGSIELEVSYTIAQASWLPLYMVDLNKEKATIQRLAQVRNYSGFDWDNIQIIITTGTRTPLSIDELDPFYLRLQPLYRERKKRALPMKAQMSMTPAGGAVALDDFAEMEEARPAPAPEPVMEYIGGEVSISETGHQRFELSGKHSIPSGKTPKTLHLDQFELELEKLYYWGSVQAKLILTHKIENSDYFLLPGSAKVFIEGEYISQSNLDLIHPKEKFTLGVVESYDLIVDKKLILRDVSKKGLIKGKRHMDFGYEIKVKNQLLKGCKIKLLDRIPHSLDENIEIELNNISLEPEKKNQGVFEWNLELEKEQELKIKYDYTVRYPPERQLSPPL